MEQSNRLTFLHKIDGRFYMYRCECGTEKSIAHYDVDRGATKSCGCLGREASIRNGLITKHGDASGGKCTPEYMCWHSLIQRCCNPNDAGYHRYGGRGITVCGRWLESFSNFLADMGRRPSPAHSIDRIDNHSGYNADNCRWATRKEQQSNVRNNRILTLNGVSRTLMQWSEATGIPRTALKNRIDEHGWSIEDALTKPLKADRRRMVPS